MAVSTKSRFGVGAVVGTPQVGSDFNRFESHSDPRHQLGWSAEDVDGNVYRYAQFGADVNRGVLVATDLSESCLGDSDGVIVASASSTLGTDGLIKTKYIEITAGDGAGAILTDQFAGGKFIVSDDAGEGYTYDIVGNTFNATSGSAFRLQLKQPLQVAVTSATDFIIVGNKYANLEIATRATDNYVSGVTCSTMDVSEASYGWVQTKGVVGILTDAGVSGVSDANEKIVLSSGTSGAVTCVGDESQTTPTLNTVLGSCIIAGDDTGHGAYYIDLE